MLEFANIWPQGGGFAFSGLDGPTSLDEPFSASGTQDAIGWEFELTPRVALRAAIGNTPLVPRNRSDDYCLSDCWRCSFEAAGTSGHVYGAFADRYSMVVVFELDAFDSEVHPRLGPSGEAHSVGDAAFMEGDGWWLAWSAEKPGQSTQIGVAISYASREEAAERARVARMADASALMRQRLRFYESAKIPSSLHGRHRRAYYKAISIVKSCVESALEDSTARRTVTARTHEIEVTPFDTALQAIGLVHVSPSLARHALLGLLATQQADGKIPCSAPGGCEHAHPPLVAWGAYQYYNMVEDFSFFSEIYDALVRHVQWYEKNRRGENGLYGWKVRAGDDPVKGARGFESRMDNSPRFDDVERLTAVDLCSYLAAEYRSLSRIASVMGKDADAEKWKREWGRIASGVAGLLWDDEDRFYYDLDEHGEFIPVKTPAGLLPMLAGIPDRDHAESLRQHVVDIKGMATPLPLASVAQDEESHSNDMWRGPVWPAMNLLVHTALLRYSFLEEAYSIAHRTVDEIVRWYVRSGCFFECYDAQCWSRPPELARQGGVGKRGGAGHGIVEDWGATAAVFIHFAQKVF